jgi:membrane protein DedA with SNARE-associated domain
MEAFIAQYGYIAIAVGTFLEGETTVLLGGIFSKLGYMKIERVMLWAFAGTLAGDCTFFLLGKLLKRNIIERYAFLRSKVPLANRIMRRYGNHIIFFVRFFVGVRGIILSLLGCTDIRKRTFLLYSTLSSLLWSILVGLIGYSFGNVVYIFVEDIKRYEKFIVPSVLAAVLVVIMVYRHIMKKREEKSYGDE